MAEQGKAAEMRWLTRRFHRDEEAASSASVGSVRIPGLASDFNGSLGPLVATDLVLRHT